MKNVPFSLSEYSFDEIHIDYSLKQDDEIKVNFNPSGEFTQKEDRSEFRLRFIFTAHNNKSMDAFIKIECRALFSFSNPLQFDEIPEYFYVNSIAILFPYIRAFISTITLQSNHPSLVLPTLNLVSLANPLRENTKVI